MPENTLEAFAHALSLGVGTLELDVGVSADGVVVVNHDRRLDPNLTRRADGTWLNNPGPLISQLTYAQLQRYDVGRARPGSAHARRFPAQQGIDGIRMPRLADVFALAAAAGNDRVRFSIETKLSPAAPEETPAPRDFAAAVITEVRAANVAQRTSIQSFDWRTLEHVQLIAPEIETVYLTSQSNRFDTIGRGRPGPSPWTAGMDIDDYDGSVPRLIKAAGGDAWSVRAGDLTRATLAEAQSLGLRVYVWTVNEARRIERFVRLGVDGVITDYPDRMRVVLAARGLALPAGTPIRP